MSANTSGSFEFDARSADLAVDFFNRFLVHVKGEWYGQPLELAEWQAEQIVRPLFGWKRADGTRRYRTVFVFVPRKNGKSTLAAGVAAKLTFADKEPGAEVYSAAADRDQARFVFDVASKMVEASPALSSRAEVLKRSITVPATGSAYRIISSEGKTKHGMNAHGVIIDELHAWATAAHEELHDALTTAAGSRRQPIIFQITTAGFGSLGICKKEYDYACKVRDGIVEDPSYLPVIFETPADAPWDDPDVWAAANPNLGISVKREYLEDQAKKASESLPEQNKFRRLHLNQWTEQECRWIDMEVWDENPTDVDLEALRGELCYGGLDLSSTEDVSAFVLAFPGSDDVTRLVCRFWIPEETASERSRRERVPYRQWIHEGHIEGTEGNSIDYRVLRKRINELAQQFHIKEIAYDRWNASQLVTELQGDGFTMVPVGQGFASMHAPSQEFHTLARARRLGHGGNPVLRWMASNVAVKMDPAGSIKPDKSKSGDRIDGIVAAVMAIGRTQLHDTSPSVYATRGIATIETEEYGPWLGA